MSLNLKSKKGLIAVVSVFLVIAFIVVGYLWVDRNNLKRGASIDSQNQGIKGVLVVTDKAMYERGEDIKFIVTNNTRNTIWYIIPASKCDKSFYGWMIRRGSDSTWVSWLSCEYGDAEAGSLEIGTLEPGENLEEIWNQDVFFSSVYDSGEVVGLETDKMFPGVYKFAFPYSENEISLKDMPPLTFMESDDFLSKQVFSDNFEIKDDGTIDLAIEKANDAMRKSDLDFIYSRLILYFDEHNDTYPISGDEMVRLNDKNSTIYKDLVPIYLSDDFMRDPDDPDSYYGYKSVDGKDFELTALLENLGDDSCSVGDDICIYKINSMGVVSRGEKDISPIVEDFSSPEATLRTYIESSNKKDLDVFLNSISQKTISENKDEGWFLYQQDVSFWPKESVVEKGKFKLIEKTDKYAIMSPQIREIPDDDSDSGICYMEDFYFEREGDLWKIDLATVLEDAVIRFETDTVGQEIVEERIANLQSEWKKSFE